MTSPYKRVLLVGATAGIGAAMADKLISEGSKVIAVGRRQERLDAFVKKHGPEKASGIRFDITDKAGMDAFVNGIVKDYPDLDCVFLNSGIQQPFKLSQPASIDIESFHLDMATNYTAIVDLSFKFLPQLQAKPYPTALIVTGSLLAIIPAVHIPAYSASKAALHAFVCSLQAASKKAQSRTKVIDLWPPPVQSELHDYMGEKAGRSFGMPVGEFTEKAYAQLVAGEELVVVGTLAGSSEEQVREVIEKRRLVTENLTKLLLPMA